MGEGIRKWETKRGDQVIPSLSLKHQLYAVEEAKGNFKWNPQKWAYMYILHLFFKILVCIINSNNKYTKDLIVKYINFGWTIWQMQTFKGYN